MMNSPLVSVVMPVYNSSRFLPQALTSIVEQSFQDWEMICVNDGSTDGSDQILEQFSQHDARIRVVHQANAGIVSALNRGCGLVRGSVICRMDSDDIALPTRLETQFLYLRKVPECVVVGGAILEMDVDGDPLCCSHLPALHADIESNLLHRKTGLFHPTTMFRTDTFHAIGGYRAEYQWVEDHDLWLRLAQHGQLANLDEVVLCYRHHPGSVCWQRAAQQRELMARLMADAYAARGLALPSHLSQASVSRSATGSGKWARAAAKGGFPMSVLKHLRELSRQPDTSNKYLIRMTVESALRLCSGYPRRLRDRKSSRIAAYVKKCG